MHQVYCEGFHTAAVSCVDATVHRADALCSPWSCPTGRNGYHLFSGEPGADAACENDGCTRAWRQLAWLASQTTPDLDGP